MITTIRKILEPITDPGPNPGAVVSLMEDRYLSRMPGISQDVGQYLDDLPVVIATIEGHRDEIIGIKDQIEVDKNVIPEQTQTQFFVGASGTSVTSSVSDTATLVSSMGSVETRRGDIIVARGHIFFNTAASASTPSVSINNTQYAVLGELGPSQSRLFNNFECTILRKSGGNLEYTINVFGLASGSQNTMLDATGAIATATDTLVGDNLDIELWGQESASVSRNYSVRQSSVYVKRNAVEQNLVLQSEALNEDGVWGRGQLEDVADSGIAAPTIGGESFGNYWKIIPNTNNSFHVLFQLPPTFPASGELSFIVRGAELSNLRFRVQSSGGSDQGSAVIDTADGSLFGNSYDDVHLADLGGGAWLVTAKWSNKPDAARVGFNPYDGSDGSFAGNGTDGILVTRVHITEDDRAPYAKTTTAIVDPLAP